MSCVSSHKTCLYDDLTRGLIDLNLSSELREDAKCLPTKKLKLVKKGYKML